jgi:hypothetical protein
LTKLTGSDDERIAKKPRLAFSVANYPVVAR